MVKTHGEGEEEEKRSPYRQVAWEWAKGNKEAAEDKEVEAGKQTRHDLDKAMVQICKTKYRVLVRPRARV